MVLSPQEILDFFFNPVTWRPERLFSGKDRYSGKIPGRTRAEVLLNIFYTRKGNEQKIGTGITEI